MTSVQNHPLQLSGNKIILTIAAIAITIAACSPKTTPTKKAPVNTTPVVKKEDKKPKPVENKEESTSVSLLLPFNAQDINMNTATKNDLKKADLAIDFYQGFKLALDSVSKSGVNFKLNVFDGRDDIYRLNAIVQRNAVKQSDLIIGPVFPDGIKAITDFATRNNKLIVSPLAATGAEEFNNPNLVTVNNSIDQHAKKIVDCIAANYRVSNTTLILLDPRKPGDEKYAGPLRKYLQSRSFRITEVSTVQGIEKYFVPNQQYVVLIATSDRNVVIPAIDKLYKLKIKPTGAINVDVFGHPMWIKQNINQDKLQRLNARISSSYKVDFKQQNTINFVRNYRALYHFEPSEFAIKGYDTGMFFALLIQRYGDDYRKHITDLNYKGIHNTFRFNHDQRLGYINTNLMILRYTNYDLRIEE